MDQITKRTLAQLEQLTRDLHNCQRRLERIGKARVPMYFGISSRAKSGFASLFYGLDEMKQILRGSPPSLE